MDIKEFARRIIENHPQASHEALDDMLADAFPKWDDYEKARDVLEETRVQVGYEPTPPVKQFTVELMKHETYAASVTVYARTPEGAIEAARRRTHDVKDWCLVDSLFDVEGWYEGGDRG
jgi:hypothetical protein